MHLFSKKLIDKYDIRFDPRLEMGEDALFNHIIYCNASRLAITDKIFYDYHINPRGLNCTKWSKNKLFSTVLWFESAIEVIITSPAFTRKPDLLQKLINERMNMLTRKLGYLAVNMLDEYELPQYLARWAKCLKYLDTDFFDTHFFPHGWPALYQNTLDRVGRQDYAGFRNLFMRPATQQNTSSTSWIPSLP